MLAYGRLLGVAQVVSSITALAMPLSTSVWFVNLVCIPARGTFGPIGALAKLGDVKLKNPDVKSCLGTRIGKLWQDHHEVALLC
jgi:hypothetical protein